MGSHPGGMQLAGRGSGGLSTTGIPSKTSMKTVYIQVQHKEKADLVYQKALAIK